MKKRLGVTFRMAAALGLSACCALGVLAQAEGELTAKARVFPDIGAGLRAVRRGPDGRTYVLASPSPGLVVFDSKGKKAWAIPTAPAGSKTQGPAIGFGEDCDIDEGHIYVADRGANAVEVFGLDGALTRSIAVPAPVSLAAIGESEVAVATLRQPHLVIVYDKNGRDVREFGDPEPISNREDLNRFLSIGQLVSDGQNRVYYAFDYTPEPTVRQYDRFGYGAGPDVQYTALEAASQGQAVRREIIRQEKHGKAPAFKRVLTAVGVDRAKGEVWMAVGNTLLRFDKEGNRRARYQLYTPEGARLEANVIVVEPDGLLIGSDPLGVYEFERPDKKFQP
jgi:hypothetical protein